MAVAAVALMAVSLVAVLTLQHTYSNMEQTSGGGYTPDTTSVMGRQVMGERSYTNPRTYSTYPYQQERHKSKHDDDDADDDDDDDDDDSEDGDEEEEEEKESRHM